MLRALMWSQELSTAVEVLAWRRPCPPTLPRRPLGWPPHRPAQSLCLWPLGVEQGDSTGWQGLSL